MTRLLIGIILGFALGLFLYEAVTELPAEDSE